MTTKAEGVADTTLRVSEVFHSIQGESTWAGLPCTFVRLTGCPLRCVWCDTEYAFDGGDRMPLSQILSLVDSYGCGLVEITGGEPLVQPGALQLGSRLIQEGYTVLVETSGALDVSGLDPRIHKIMDLKCPGSGEVGRNLWSNLDHLTHRDEIKFVVSGPEDLDWLFGVVKDKGLDARLTAGELNALLVSPVWGSWDLKALSAAVLETGLPLRVQTQLHKHIWGPMTPGV